MRAPKPVGKNGAKSRGPRTAEGGALGAKCARARHAGSKARPAAGRRRRRVAQLEAALVEELAPVGALQTMLARRVAIAAWRLARADRIEADLFAERWLADGGPGIALIRGPRV
jgi:hypothetical protein